MNELLDKLKNLSLNSTDTSIIETDDLIIKDNILQARNECLQIHNISMLSKSELKAPISSKNFLILAILFITIFIPPLTLAGILFFTLYAINIYFNFKKHLNRKYFIIFNLGSSQNYYLFFKSSLFRDQVFKVVSDSFSHSANTNIIIDFKTETIENHTIFESGSTQNHVSGDNNIVGDNNTTTYNGDITSHSNIVTDSDNTNASMNNNTLPWDTLTTELQIIISENQQLLSNQVLDVFNQLLKAVKEQNTDKLNTITSENKSLFDTSLIKDIITGTASGVLASILMPK